MASTTVVREAFSGVLAPPDKGDLSRIARFMDAVADHQSTSRLELEAEFLENKAFIESHQWTDYRGSSDPRYARQFVDSDEDEEGVAIVVNNEIYPIVDSERSRMGKRRSQPYVRPRRGDDSSGKAASTIGDDILDASMDEMRWPFTYRDWCTDIVFMGTGVLCLEWATDYRKSVRTGLTTAMKCSKPGCAFSLAHPEIPMQIAAQLPPEQLANVQAKEVIKKGGLVRTHQVTRCLSCGSDLEPWEPAMGQEAAGVDAFKRPVGEDVPLGDTLLRRVMPQYMFVENEGVGLNPGPIGQDGCPNWYCEDRPQSLDMIAAMYEMGEKVTADEPNELMQLFPMTGEYANSSVGYSGASGRQIYQAHARHRRYIQGPTRKNPMGRMIVLAGGTGKQKAMVLVDDELMIQSSDDPGLKIPKVMYYASRFFPKENEFWGQSVVVPLKSPQRRINMSLSQLVMNRERNGNDGWLVTPGMRVTAPGWTKQYPGNINVWQKDPENPNAEPKEQRGRLMDPGVWQEINFSIQRMQVIAGYAEVNQGGLPTGVTAGTAIEQLANQTNERREMREMEMVDNCREVFKQTIQLKRERVREKRTYLVKSEGDMWTERQYKGADLKGQGDIVVDEEPSYDVKGYNREMAIQGINLRIMPTDTAYARREARKAIGITTTVADAEDRQVEDAERKWHRFVMTYKTPAIDPNADDHVTHWDTYGLNWKGGDGIALREKVHFDDVLDVIAGWRKDFDNEENLRASYEGAVLSGALDRAVKSVQTSQQMMDTAKSQGIDAATAAQVPGTMAPPNDVEMLKQFKDYVPPPEATERLVELVMVRRLLQERSDLFEAPPAPPELDPISLMGQAPPLPGEMPGTMPGPGAENPLDMDELDEQVEDDSIPEAAREDGLPAFKPVSPDLPKLKDPLCYVLRMYAVSEAHFILAQRKKAEAVMAPTPAAPGSSSATAAGTEASGAGAPVAA